MEKYDPLYAPDPVAWLELDESERIGLVEEFHRGAGTELPEPGLHAGIHVVVENQLALGEEPVPATIGKLIRQGLDRHEAIHAVGAIIAEDLFGLMQGEQGQWDAQRYRKRLEKLTAKRWRKGQW